MALAQNERSPVSHSDIRELETNDLEATKAFEQIGNRRQNELIGPPLTLDSAIDEYARLTQKDPTVSHALRIGDLPHSVLALMQENFQLRREIESSRADFEELRSVNMAIQEQADASLRAADDQRLELLDELERTRGELLELESQIETALQRSRERSRTSSAGIRRS